MQTDNQKILNKKLNNFKQQNKELKKRILTKWQNYCMFKNNDLALFWKTFIALNIIINLEEDEKKYQMLYQYVLNQKRNYPPFKAQDKIKKSSAGISR